MAENNLSILIAGESASVTSLFLKGIRAYAMGSYEEGQTPLVDALESGGNKVTYIRNHFATQEFPSSIEALENFQVVILSDIGADTLLLHPDTLHKSKIMPNRLKLIAEFVEKGGGLLMVGGYMSFGGLDGLARYAHTPLATVLPVAIYPYDDRIETPEGVKPEVTDESHPVVANMPKTFPTFLGYNRVVAKSEASVVMKVDSDPFLVLGNYGKGRTAAFTSDCSPHWATSEFINEPYYADFWNGLVLWLANKR